MADKQIQISNLQIKFKTKSKIKICSLFTIKFKIKFKFASQICSLFSDLGCYVAGIGWFIHGCSSRIDQLCRIVKLMARYCREDRGEFIGACCSSNQWLDQRRKSIRVWVSMLGDRRIRANHRRRRSGVRGRAAWSGRRSIIVGDWTFDRTARGFAGMTGTRWWRGWEYGPLFIILFYT